MVVRWHVSTLVKVAHCLSPWCRFGGYGLPVRYFEVWQNMTEEIQSSFTNDVYDVGQACTRVQVSEP